MPVPAERGAAPRLDDGSRRGTRQRGQAGQVRGGLGARRRAARDRSGGAVRRRQVRARGRAAAALSLQQVSALGPDLADARTPQLKINWAERSQGLTRREREVALMAASGLSSRTIAAKLQLSVRTVSNHLAHVYAKFGVASRAELATLLTTATATADRPA